jgi:hypothetical protein
MARSWTWPLIATASSWLAKQTSYFPRLQYIEVLRILKACIGCNAEISVTLWLFNSLLWFFDGPFIEIDGKHRSFYSMVDLSMAGPVRHNQMVYIYIFIYKIHLLMEHMIRTSSRNSRSCFCLRSFLTFFDHVLLGQLGRQFPSVKPRVFMAKAPWNSRLGG